MTQNKTHADTEVENSWFGLSRANSTQVSVNKTRSYIQPQCQINTDVDIKHKHTQHVKLYVSIYRH